MELTFETKKNKQKIKDNAYDFLTVPAGLSYPDHYDIVVDIPSVGCVTVRPIRETDSFLFENLFEAMTPHSVYLRFFSFLRQLPQSMLVRFTQIDYNMEIALVAIIKECAKQVMIGDARVVHSLETGSAEFSVMVADEWQGKGVGACLLQHCLSLARLRGFNKIHGIVLADNRHMLALGRKLDFTIKRIPGSTEYELSKNME